MKIYWSAILLVLSITAFSQDIERLKMSEDDVVLDYLGINQINQEFDFSKDAVEAFQIGQHNVLMVDQSSLSNRSNYILSLQSGNNNLIDATQEGQRNTMDLVQVGNNNEFNLIQEGDDNLIDLIVAGNHNSFDVTQEGSENSYVKLIGGNNYSETVEQIGNNNSLEVSEGIQIPLMIKQTGGMKLIIK